MPPAKSEVLAMLRPVASPKAFIPAGPAARSKSTSWRPVVPGGWCAAPSGAAAGVIGRAGWSLEPRRRRGVVVMELLPSCRGSVAPCAPRLCASGPTIDDCRRPRPGPAAAACATAQVVSVPERGRSRPAWHRVPGSLYSPGSRGSRSLPDPTRPSATPDFLQHDRPPVPDIVVPRGIQPFHLQAQPVRGRLIRLGPLAEALLTRHDNHP